MLQFMGSQGIGYDLGTEQQSSKNGFRTESCMGNEGDGMTLRVSSGSGWWPCTWCDHSSSCQPNLPSQQMKGKGDYLQMKARREQQLSLPCGGLKKLFPSSALNGMAFVSCFPIIMCYLGDSLGSRKGQWTAGGTKFPAVIQSQPLLRKSDLSKVTSKCLPLL